MSLPAATARDYIHNMQQRTTVQQWLRSSGYGDITACHKASGGCINDTSLLDLSNGDTLFLKQQTQAPPDFFTAEAAGLNALRQTGTLRVPRVIHAEPGFLLLEDLGIGTPGPRFWHQLGEGLAALHREEQDEFGFFGDNYCGLTPQRNTPCYDGYQFFARQRLMALARQAAIRRQLDSADMLTMEFIVANLNRWIPLQAPVLIHGDLWSGNVHCDGAGQPALIDPACYWGWAEAELAMTTLFGGFPASFHEAYQANSDMDPQWRERADIYNLYHLLNHLLLFGVGYLGQVRAVLKRYGPR